MCFRVCLLISLLGAVIIEVQGGTSHRVQPSSGRGPGSLKQAVVLSWVGSKELDFNKLLRYGISATCAARGLKHQSKQLWRP